MLIFLSQQTTGNGQQTLSIFKVSTFFNNNWKKVVISTIIYWKKVVILCLRERL